MKEDKINKLMSDIQEFIEEFKKRSNGDMSKITTKELLFFFINKFNELDDRIDELEKEQVKTKTTIKNIVTAVTIACSILGTLIGYIGL